MSLVIKQPMLIVIRIGDVILTRSELETALGVDLARFSAARLGPMSYAQIDVPDGDAWVGVSALARQIGPVCADLVAKGSIARPTADIALALPDEAAMITYRIPNEVAAALGHAGFDVEISIYLTSPGEC